MKRMGDADGHSLDLVALARMTIPQMALVLRAFAARDLPGRSGLAPPVQQLLALLPAQYKADGVLNIKHSHGPLANSGSGYPLGDVADVTAPRLETSREQLLQLSVLVAGPVARPRPALPGCDGRCADAPQNQQPQPVQTRHADWATAGLLEEAWTNASHAAGVAGGYTLSRSMR
jgi:hypothetical protein